MFCNTLSDLRDRDRRRCCYCWYRSIQQLAKSATTDGDSLPHGLGDGLAAVILSSCSITTIATKFSQEIIQKRALHWLLIILVRIGLYSRHDAKSEQKKSRVEHPHPQPGGFGRRRLVVKEESILLRRRNPTNKSNKSSTGESTTVAENK